MLRAAWVSFGRPKPGPWGFEVVALLFGIAIVSMAAQWRRRLSAPAKTALEAGEVLPD